MSAPDAARESQLREILGNNKTVASGFLRLLSLDAVRERMGAKWQARSTYIQYVTESAIKRHLQRGQTFYQVNDSSYVIIFDFDAEDRAQYICRAISREIIQRLLGSSENKDDDLAMEMRVAVVDCDQLRQGAELPAALEYSLAAAAPRVITSSDAAGIGNAAMPTEGRSHGGAAAGEEQASDLALRGLLLEAGKRMAAGGDPRSVAGSPVDLPGFDVRYLSFWNVNARAFLAYRIDPRLRTEGHAPLRVDSLRDEIGDPDLIRGFDRLLLDLSLLDLNHSIAAGGKYVAVVPVHVESLEREADQKSLLKFLQQQPASTLRLLTFEIVDTKKSRLLDLVRYIWMLRDRCRQVVLRQELSSVPWLQSQHLPDGAVGMSVMIPSAVVPEPQIVEEMNAFVKAVTKYRIETFAYGLRSRSLAFAAIGAGFNHVSGAAIADRTRSPEGVASAAMDDLFPAPKE
jgi:hypothetical protein